MGFGTWRARAGVAFAAILGVAAARAQAPLSIREFGSFHVGGKETLLDGQQTREIVFTPGAPPLRVDPNGEFETGQMYVQYMKLANPKARYPLLMWHGGGMTGVAFETKPDGKPGWQQFFLAAGHDVYVSDAVERGRAGWSRYPEIFRTEPFFRPKKEGWVLFRIGPPDGWSRHPAERKPYEGQQFPVEAYDQFVKQGVPRWATNDPATQAAYDALVRKVCPCVIMAHSQGGAFAYTAALNNADLVKGVITLEPSSSPPPDKTDFRRIRNIPHLIVFGDHLDRQPLWTRLLINQQKYFDALKDAGVPVDWFDLPRMGMRGNSHMLMMDRNSDQIASLINDWMVVKGLTVK
jgi:pimeloyl-ACP methyl ester carboxylesterase